MTIYFDLLVFENFIFNLFVFYISFKMLNFKLNIYKLVFSSMISSLLCTLIFLNLNSTLYLIFVILLSFFANVYLCIPKFTVRYFFQIFITLIVISFLLFSIINLLVAIGSFTSCIHNSI